MSAVVLDCGRCDQGRALEWPDVKAEIDRLQPRTWRPFPRVGLVPSIQQDPDLAAVACNLWGGGDFIVPIDALTYVDAGAHEELFGGQDLNVIPKVLGLGLQPREAGWAGGMDRGGSAASRWREAAQQAADRGSLLPVRRIHAEVELEERRTPLCPLFEPVSGSGGGVLQAVRPPRREARDGLPRGGGLGIAPDKIAEQVVEPEVVVCCPAAGPILQCAGGPFTDDLVLRSAGEEPARQLQIRSRVREREEIFGHIFGQPFVQSTIAIGRGVSPDAAVFVQKQDANYVREGRGGNLLGPQIQMIFQVDVLADGTGV